MEKTCAAIAKACGAAVQLVVVCGRNAKLANRLQQRKWPEGMHVLVQAYSPLLLASLRSFVCHIWILSCYSFLGIEGFLTCCICGSITHSWFKWRPMKHLAVQSKVVKDRMLHKT